MNEIEKGLSRIIGRAIRKNDAGRKDIGIHSLVEDTVKEVLEFLDSENVVREVDRELPTYWMGEEMPYRMRSMMIEAGYVAVERLVKE